MDSELKVKPIKRYGEELNRFFMHYICVDGIYGENHRDYGYQFFTLKEESEEWDDPYVPNPDASYEYGDIDEDLWLKDGAIVGKESPNYSYFKNL